MRMYVHATNISLVVVLIHTLSIAIIDVLFWHSLFFSNAQLIPTCVLSFCGSHYVKLQLLIVPNFLNSVLVMTQR